MQYNTDASACMCPGGEGYAVRDSDWVALAMSGEVSQSLPAGLARNLLVVICDDKPAMVIFTQRHSVIGQPRNE